MEWREMREREALIFRLVYCGVHLSWTAIFVHTKRLSSLSGRCLLDGEREGGKGAPLLYGVVWLRNNKDSSSTNFSRTNIRRKRRRRSRHESSTKAIVQGIVKPVMRGIIVICEEKSCWDVIIYIVKYEYLHHFGPGKFDVSIQ